MRIRRPVQIVLAASVAAALWITALRIDASPQAAGASAKTWIGETAKIEAALKTAEIVRFEDIGTGVTKPRRAYLKPGGLIESFTWKPLSPGRRGGYWESYKAEIAAYELDKRLKLNMVPPVVEREVDGQRGAAVMWIEPTTSVREMGGTIPAGEVPAGALPNKRSSDNSLA